MKRAGLLVLAGLGVGLLTGCGVNPNTCMVVPAMIPSVATADHNAAAPGNEASFEVGAAVKGSATGCAVPQVVYLPTLKSSDTVNVKIVGPGVAECVGTTTVPAVLTDVQSGVTAELNCK